MIIKIQKWIWLPILWKSSVWSNLKTIILSINMSTPSLNTYIHPDHLESGGFSSNDRHKNMKMFWQTKRWRFLQKQQGMRILWSFPLVMKGMDGGCSTHKKLMMMLSKRVHIVMTNEYWSTKACPKCKDKTIKMKWSKGNRVSRNWKYYFHHHNVSCFKSHDGYHRNLIHGLSQCDRCNTLWPRDYVASLNISRSFKSYFKTGAAADYLART